MILGWTVLIISPPPCCPPLGSLNLRQVEFYRGLLPRLLSQLPGGGLANGSILEVGDQEQHFKAQLIMSHRVSRGRPPVCCPPLPPTRGSAGVAWRPQLRPGMHGTAWRAA